MGLIELDDRVTAAYSDRHFGNTSFAHGDTSNSRDNRVNFLRSIAADPDRLVSARQVHADAVYHAHSIDAGRGAYSVDTAIPDTDAIITDDTTLPISISTADCLSVFLFDRRLLAAGMIHAGWRSTQRNIAAKTLNEMREVFGTNPKDIVAGFGPCIRGCCYEVGPQFFKYFHEGVTERDGRVFFDLAKENKSQLTALGVSAGAITDCGICTSCGNKDYFSFRKEGETCGRMLSCIFIK